MRYRSLECRRIDGQSSAFVDIDLAAGEVEPVCCTDTPGGIKQHFGAYAPAISQMNNR